PNVVAEDWIEALRKRRVLVAGGDDFEFAAGKDEPAPSRAELLGGGLVEGLFEGFEIAEISRYLLGDIARGIAADPRCIRWSHDGPEHRMVGVSPAIVAND